MSEAFVRHGLSIAEHAVRVRADARHVEALLQEYMGWPGAYRPAHDDKEPADRGEGRALFRFLSGKVADLTARMERMNTLHQRYLHRFESTTHPREKADLALAFAQELGASPAQLRGDRRALRRHFDLGAVVDRCQEQRAAHEQLLAIILRRLGPLAAWLLGQEAGPGGSRRAWEELSLERLLLPLLLGRGDVRVRVEAFRAILGPLAVLPASGRDACLSDQTLRLIFRAAIGREDPLWIQHEALGCLPELDREAFSKALTRRILEPGPGDDFFLRCRAITLLGTHFGLLPNGLALLRHALEDPSPRVRQRVAEAARLNWARGGREILECLLEQDPTPAVRAAALLALEALVLDPGASGVALDLLAASLEREADPFVVRTALHLLRQLGDRLASYKAYAGMAGLASRFLPLLERCHCSHPNLAVRRWAAHTREHLWCRSHPVARKILSRIRILQAQIPEGGGRPAPELEVFPEALVGRVLSEAARFDFGLGLRRKGGRLHLLRGETRKLRLWRFLHEFRNPDPAKRQGYAHTIGRHFRGRLRAPSSILGELAETKVPGEPCFIPAEAGWRPYLPLLDEAVSLIEWGAGDHQVSIYTSEGITELRAPRGILKWKACVALSLGFTPLARMRNWQEADVIEPSAYLRGLEGHGFTCTFRAYGEAEGLPTEGDPAVLRFFPAMVVPPFLAEPFQNLRDYFYSTYGNTLADLLLFTVGTGVWFLGRNIARHHRMRHHRRRIPVVIGGWGTRGKSGTERLKAALFSGLGYGVVSKTTGCESMFLYGKPFQDLQEMFLFRPYDKVSIQEQTFVVRMASKLGADVFLWECMALSPPLVQLLQEQWMQDDLSTLTNAFPDHEDVQGPAGHDIPRVMTHFIPEGRVLYTSEENMLPILSDSAKAKGTRIRGASWLEAGLLTEDVLSRFPYQEHPDNVALVLAMAEDLGVDPDFALKEMADRVVADLGVLKTFPDAAIQGRRLRFTNGMSANEPFGALGNWKRVGFAGHDPEGAPGEWITAVVNNRADRVARSQVFAQLIAESLSADQYVLIGGNLTGFMGYIRDAFAGVAARLRLDAEGPDDRSRAEGILVQAAQRLRIPASPGQVGARLAAMFRGLDLPMPANADSLSHPEALAEHLRSVGQLPWLADFERHRARWSEQWEAFLLFRSRIQDPGQPLAALNESFRHLIEGWFQRKFTIVEDYFAPGDKVIESLIAGTPPGYLNRCMGLQNIKGTGLDFIYRFMAWDACHAGCLRLRSAVPEVAGKALDELLAFREFGLLSEALVRETLEWCRDHALGRDPAWGADLDRLRSHFEAQVAAIRENMARSTAPSLKQRLLGWLESLLDTQDSLRRSWQARGIYRDLLKGRISRIRAVEELRRLTKRQYGGWLQGKV